MRRSYPKGYLKEEVEFTRCELDAFMDHKDMDEEKERLRHDVFVKRNIFKKYWEVEHNVILNWDEYKI
jgi:hypothetical protein